MAFHAGKKGSILRGSADLSAYFNRATSRSTMKADETTTYQPTGEAKTYISAGIVDGMLSLGGLWDGSAAAVDAILAAVLAAAQGAPVSYAPAGWTIGFPVEILAELMTQYGISQRVDGGPVGIAAEFEPDGLVEGAVSLHALGTEVGVVNSASVDELGASSANGGVAHLHVTAVNTLTTATLKVQHSTDDAVWADLATFTAVTAVVGQRLVIAPGTTVNRYVRGALTVLTGTSITYAMAFARR